MGYIEKSTLLAFKPFLFNTRVKTLHPHTLPDYVWPSNRVVTSPCQWHEEPEEMCTCGVYSTIDIEAVDAFVNCPIDLEVSELMPLMGVVQVLGKTIHTDLTFRSWGAYLWGVLYPTGLDGKWFVDNVLDPLWFLDFDPVVYRQPDFAWFDVKHTLENYNLLEVL